LRLNVARVRSAWPGRSNCRTTAWKMAVIYSMSLCFAADSVALLRLVYMNAFSMKRINVG